MKTIINISILLIAFNVQSQTVELTSWKGNSYNPEYAPAFWNNGLVICSNVAESYAVSWYDDGGMPDSDLYYCPDFNNRKKDAMPLTGVNSKFNEGPCCFSADGLMIFYTGTIQDPKHKKNTWLGIFISTYDSGSWTTPRAFEFNSSDGSYNIAHPGISADGNELYFASDMQGGLGKMDIWKSTKSPDGKWNTPVNLGSIVNSGNNEMFPFIAENRWLYFSADLRDGIADYDVYKCFPACGMLAEALPAPINSDANEYGLIVRKGGDEGFFTSDRKGRGDIFRYVMPKEEIICTPVEAPSFCYLIEDDRITPTPNLPLRYTWDFGDGHSGNGITTQHCYADYGSYNVQLNVYDTITSLLYAQVSQTVIDIINPEMPFIVCPNIIELGKSIQLKCDLSTVPGMEVESFEWEFGDGTFDRGQEVQKTWESAGTFETKLKLLCRINGNPPSTVCVSKVMEIKSEEEILAMNITNGETKINLAVTSGSSDQTAMTESLVAGLMPAIVRDENRRVYFVEFRSSDIRIPLDGEYFSEVEYEITERFSEEEEMYIYSVGESEYLADLFPLYEAMLEAGYLESIVKESDEITMQEEINAASEEDMASTTMVGINKPAFRDEIFFQKNSAVLSDRAKSILDELNQIMTNDREIRVVVRAYCDSSGTAKLNKVLSCKRALAAKDYLTSHSIHPSRITAIGMGEKNQGRTAAEREDPEFQRKVEFELYYEEENGKKR